MSRKLSLPIIASRRAENPDPFHRDEAFSPSRGMSIRMKVIIAAIAIIFALLYAKGAALMIDAADTPDAYTTFLHRAD
jgi:hypothetical protein